MIKKLHIYVIKNFIPPFIATFLVSVFVLILQFLWLYVDDLIGKGLEAWVITKLLFYASIQLVPLAMPISVMLASIMTFGNMGEHYELTAIKAAGISLLRIFKPMIIISLFLAFLNFYFSDKIVPEATLKLQTLLFDIRQRHPALNFQEGIFNYDVEGYVIRISKKNPENDMMYNFLVYDHKNAKANNRVIAADSGQIQVTKDYQYLILTLYHGCQYEEIPESETDFSKRKFPYREDCFDRYRVIIKLEGFQMRETDERIFRSSYNILSIKSLRNRIDSLYASYKRRQKFYQNLILTNYMFTRAIKLYGVEDTFNYYRDLVVWRQLSPKEMKVLIDLDSAYNHLDLNAKQDVINIALTNANRIYSQLKVARIDLKSKKIWIAKHEIALYRKFTYAIACLIFFFIGAPLGAIIRKGGFGFPTIVSILIFLTYYVVSIISENLVLQGVLNPKIGMWISTALFFPISIYLVYRVSTDRVITNFDYYLERAKEIVIYILKFRFLSKKYKINPR